MDPTPLTAAQSAATADPVAKAAEKAGLSPALIAAAKWFGGVGAAFAGALLVLTGMSQRVEQGQRQVEQIQRQVDRIETKVDRVLEGFPRFVPPRMEAKP